MAITPGVSRTLRRDWITVSPCLRQSGQQMYGQLTCASPGPGPNIRRPFAHKCPSFPIGILEDTHTYIALDRDIHTISRSSSSGSSSRGHLTPVQALIQPLASLSSNNAQGTMDDLQSVIHIHRGTYTYSTELNWSQIALFVSSQVAIMFVGWINCIQYSNTVFDKQTLYILEPHILIYEQINRIHFLLYCFWYNENCIL